MTYKVINKIDGMIFERNATASEVAELNKLYRGCKTVELLAVRNKGE